MKITENKKTQVEDQQLWRAPALVDPGTSVEGSQCDVSSPIIEFLTRSQCSAMQCTALQRFQSFLSLVCQSSKFCITENPRTLH